MGKKAYDVKETRSKHWQRNITVVTLAWKAVVLRQVALAHTQIVVNVAARNVVHTYVLVNTQQTKSNQNQYKQKSIDLKEVHEHNMHTNTLARTGNV
jgi:hypothetical protein